MKNELTIGMKLFGVKNDRRGNPSSEIFECTITRFGRRYFYVDMFKDKGFLIENLLYINPEYSQFNIQLYRDKKTIIENQEYNELLDAFRKAFGIIKRGQFTLEQLRNAATALNLNYGQPGTSGN